MDGKSDAMNNNNCAYCGILSNLGQEGFCLACCKLQPNCAALEAVNAASNQSELMKPNTIKQLVDETVAKSTNKKASNVSGIGDQIDDNAIKSSLSKLNKHSKVILKKKPKNRCLVCLKKIGLHAVQCRCGGHFCAFHRYSDRHDCKFDYRAFGAEEILRNNPRVVAAKINKI